MLNNTLQVTDTGAIVPSSEYAVVEMLQKSSLYSDASAPIDEPSTLFVSHELSKDGNTRNSVIILKDIVLDADEVTTGRNQAMFKLTSDINVVSKAENKALMLKLGLLLVGACLDPDGTIEVPTATISANLDADRFLNGEH